MKTEDLAGIVTALTLIALGVLYLWPTNRRRGGNDININLTVDGRDFRAPQLAVKPPCPCQGKGIPIGA